MRIEDCKIGMEVFGKNMFGLTYFITKINKATVWIEHRTGEKIMRGGKWIDEIFIYKGVRPSTLRPANVSRDSCGIKH